MLRTVTMFVSLAFSVSVAFGDTKITVFFTNNGGEIQNLQITDNVCGVPKFSGHFAAQDAKQIDDFCVRDASSLVTEITINADGTNNSPSGPVPANSSVDVSTGRVTQP